MEACTDRLLTFAAHGVAQELIRAADMVAIDSFTLCAGLGTRWTCIPDKNLLPFKGCAPHLPCTSFPSPFQTTAWRFYWGLDQCLHSNVALVGKRGNSVSGSSSVAMEEETCEVCTDTLDATDSSISFCDCNYALCLWCACASGRCVTGIFVR